MKKFTISLDLVPYQATLENNTVVFKDFTAFDLQVPERFQNRQGGDYCKLNTSFTDKEGEIQNKELYVYHYEDKELKIEFFKDLTIEQVEEAICNMFEAHYDAMTEIGWEALEQAE